jgi:hypothetical protein
MIWQLFGRPPAPREAAERAKQQEQRDALADFHNDHESLQSYASRLGVDTATAFDMAQEQNRVVRHNWRYYVRKTEDGQ